MALKAKNDEEDESSEDENSKFKVYITKQFNKFIKNVNVKVSDKDHKKSGFPQSKSQDRFKRETKDIGHSSNTPTGPKCYGCQGYRHMKQECPTYLKSIGKSKALAITLSDTEPEADSEDSDQEETFIAFIATTESPKEFEELVDEEEELMDSKFDKLDENDDIQIA